ncbi:MAG: hypothetical protein HKL80_10375 [Acidimicrobiales bacterium]|nr:hypothetical protein [Acidimicrobiales bacterium]
MRFDYLRVLITAGLLTVGCSNTARILWSQSTSSPQSQSARLPAKFTKAENEWRQTPVDLATQQDNVAPLTRAARNAYWKPKLNEYRVASQKGLDIGSPIVRYLDDRLDPEISTNAGSIWVLAQCDHYRVIPITPDAQVSASDLMLYTEIIFKINQILWQPKVSLLKEGEYFDAEFEGGSAKTLQGEVLLQRIGSEKYFVQPEHSYLLQIVPSPVGNFYYINKQWDITSGKAVPDCLGEVMRASHGRSKLNEMPISDIPEYVSSSIAKEVEK